MISIYDLHNLEKYRNNLPKSLLIVGISSDENKEVAEYLSRENKMDFIEFTDKVNNDNLIEINTITNKTVIYIELDQLTEKEQNILLKSVEEPSANVFFILITSDKNTVLSTIRNRCVEFSMHLFSKDELKHSYFADKSDLDDNSILVLEMAKTPLQCKIYNDYDLINLRDKCNLIIDKINVATLPNTLSIQQKYIDEYTDELFIKMLSYCIKEKMKIKNDNKLVNMYKAIIEYNYIMRDKRNKKDRIIDNLLLHLWLSVNRGV